MKQSEQLTLTGERTKPYLDKQRLQKLYNEENNTITEIATELDCSEATIRNYLRAFDLWGENGAVSFYTGGNGYEHLHVDHHHFRVHRLLVIAEYGLDALEGDCVVHHETEIPWDNRIEELHVFANQSAHRRHHARPAIDEDQELLDSYPTADEQENSGQQDRRPQQTTLLSFSTEDNDDE